MIKSVLCLLLAVTAVSALSIWPPHGGCPLLSCPQVYCPNKVCSSYGVRGGRQCPGCCSCPQLTTRPPPTPRPRCPLVRCAALHCPVGQEPRDQYTIFNGLRCKTCPKCVRISFPCPRPLCLRPACEAGEEETPGTFTFRGKECPGCPTCEPVSCPVPGCIRPNCPPGQAIRPTTFPFKGLTCDGCPECQTVSCPIPLCVELNCRPGEESKPTTFELHGLTCNGCPRCEPVEISCPLVDCPHVSRYCPHGKEFVPRATRNSAGEICLGCRACLPRCLATPCARPTCSNPEPTQVIQNGRVCPGCGRCPHPNPGPYPIGK